MITITLSIIIFLEIVQYLVFFDVILSWLTLFGVRFRPAFLVNIIEPLYKVVRKYIPTRFGAFDFTPIVIIFLLYFVRGAIVLYTPWGQTALNSLTK